MHKIVLIAAALALAAGPAHAGPVAAAVAWVGSTIAAGGALGFVVQMAVSTGLSLLAQAIAGKPRRPEINVQFEVQLGDDHPLTFVAGDYVTAGKRKYIGSWGKSTRYITEVIEVSALPQGFDGLWVDDEPGEFHSHDRVWKLNPSAAPGSVSDQVEMAPGTNPSWLLVGRPLRNYADDGNRIYVKWVDGAQLAADPFLVRIFGADPDYPWTAAMVGRGKSYAIITTRYDSETLQNYPAYLLKPAPLAMYDLRFDSTNGGSGPQRWDVPATWQPTRNPAVIAYNLIRGVYFQGEWVFGGRNLPAWRLPAAEWIAAANECDAPVPLAGGGSEPAWRCGMEISVDMTGADVLEEIGRAANMRFAEVGGQIKPIVGLPGAAVFSFTDDDIIITEGQSFRPFAPVSETYNAIGATYPEPAEKWATKDSPEYVGAAATAEDGGRYLPTGVSYPAAPYAQQVQRLQRSQLQDYRRMRRHQFHLPPEAYTLEPGVDMVSWTSRRNGYVSKLFLVESVAKTRGMNVLVSLREVDPGDYDWDSGFEFPVTITPPVNPIPYVQPVPGFAVSATSVRDGAGQPRRAAILVECAPDEAGVTAIHVEARLPTGRWSPASLFAAGEQGAWFDLSDLSLMYQDHLGATPSVVGQPVGLVLDRSQGQPGPQLGNMDLKPSDFTINGGAVVITDLGDRLRLTRTAAAATSIQAEYRSLPVQAGKTYEAEFRLLAVGGGSTVRSYTAVNNGGATDFGGFGYQASASTNRRINVATGAGSGTLHLRLSVARSANPSASVEGDWIEVSKTYSVRELPGNHAKQPTTTARPTLMQSGVVPYLYRDPVDDALPWTAPAGSYDIVHIPLTGPATVLTEQALSGGANILLAENTRAYIALNRRLTGDEMAALSAWLQGSPPPATLTVVLSETYPYTAPHGWYLRDVLPRTTYEVRARLLSDLTPVSEWSPWHEVTTLDITFQLEDLSQDILDQFEAIAAEAGIATVEALPAEGDFDNQIVMLVPQGVLYRWDEAELEWTTKVYAGVGPNTVTTDALVAGAVIASKLAAGAVTADKIDVNELSAITAIIGILRTATSGARQEIHNDKILIYDASNTVRVRLGNLI